jgi:hypothetical protein
MLRLEVLENFVKVEKLNTDAVVQLQIKRPLLVSASQYQFFLMLNIWLLHCII